MGRPCSVFPMKQFSENIPPVPSWKPPALTGPARRKPFCRSCCHGGSGYWRLAILTFISSWNDYFLQLMTLNTWAVFTISASIATLQLEMSTDLGLIMAGAALAAIPIVRVFLLFHRGFHARHHNGRSQRLKQARKRVSNGSQQPEISRHYPRVLCLL